MSGAQALVSLPVSQPSVGPREAGGSLQDSATTDAAGAAFGDVLEGVDQRKAPASRADDTTDDGREVASEDEDQDSKAQTSQPVQGSLAATLAAFGMPWGPGASATDAQAASAPSSSLETADPLALLTRALAANDREALPSEPVSDVTDEFVDARILTRERYLGAEELVLKAQSALSGQQGANGDVQKPANAQPDASANGVAEGALQNVDALVQRAVPGDVQGPANAQPDTIANGVAEGALQDVDALVQRAVPAASVLAAKDAASAAAAQDSDIETVNTSTTAVASGANSAGAVGHLRPLTQKQGENSSLAWSDVRDSQASDGDRVAELPDVDFTTMMQKGAGPAAQPLMAGTTGDRSPVFSPASQIADQLAQPAVREVISEVKTSGDTKVIELQLKPEHLGTVTVRVSLKDDVISLKLEAQRAETAQEISREVAKLANTLKDAGYLVDGITAQQMDSRTLSRIEAATSSGASGGSAQGQAQSYSQGQSSQGGGASAQQNGQSRNGAGAFDPSLAANNNGAQNNGLAPERKSGLYV